MRQDATLATQWDAVKREYVHSLFDKLSSVTAQLARAEFSKEDGAAVQALKAAQDGYKHMTSRLNPSAYGDTKDKNTGVTVIINTSLPVGVGDKPLEVVDGDFKVVVPLLENANG
jgi:hypothetical protein